MQDIIYRRTKLNTFKWNFDTLKWEFAKKHSKHKEKDLIELQENTVKLYKHVLDWERSLYELKPVINLVYLYINKIYCMSAEEPYSKIENTFVEDTVSKKIYTTPDTNLAIPTSKVLEKINNAIAHQKSIIELKKTQHHLYINTEQERSALFSKLDLSSEEIKRLRSYLYTTKLRKGCDICGYTQIAPYSQKCACGKKFEGGELSVIKTFELLEKHNRLETMSPNYYASLVSKDLKVDTKQLTTLIYQDLWGMLYKYVI